MSQETDVYTSAHPNAGLPNAFGSYDQSPEEMSELIENYLKENLINIIGGCCGSTPKHIALISDVVKKYKPREIEITSV